MITKKMIELSDELSWDSVKFLEIDDKMIIFYSQAGVYCVLEGTSISQEIEIGDIDCMAKLP